MFWDPAHWQAPFEQFAKASGLTITIFDPALVRRFGPMMSQPLAKLLATIGSWSEGRPAERFEHALAARCLEQGKAVTELYADALRVDAVPALHDGQVEAVFVIGWVFDHFADPVRCERLGRALETPGHALWLTARQQPPVSAERFQVLTELLRTLSGSIINELSLLEALRETGRMKDEFLATVSHELKTPLTSMQLRAQMLHRLGLLSDDRSRKIFEALERGIEAQSRLVDDLLDGSRLVSGKLRLDPRPLDLSEVVRHALETIQPSASAKRVAVRYSAPERELRTIGDPGRLQQVLLNLLSNAVKFTPPEGTIWLRVREQGRQVTIEIADTGRGIEKAFLPFVFDRFSQARLTLGVGEQGPRPRPGDRPPHRRAARRLALGDERRPRPGRDLRDHAPARACRRRLRKKLGRARSIGRARGFTPRRALVRPGFRSPRLGPQPRGRLRVEARAEEVDELARLVSLDPRVVAGRDERHVAGPERDLLAVVHPDGEPAGEHVAGVLDLAAARARDRLHVLRPLPAGLVDAVGRGSDLRT